MSGSCSGSRTVLPGQAAFAASGADPMARNSWSRTRLTSRVAVKSLAAWSEVLSTCRLKIILQ